MRAAARLLVIALLLLATFQPTPSARGAEGPLGAATIGDEIAAAPELPLPEAMPEPGRREIGYLNGKFLILNMHGALFHQDVEDIYEDLSYATWLNAGVIRVFAT